MESLPTKLSLSTRTTDYAMSQPAKANYPISNSMNVMGPNPLIYPANYNPDDRETSSTRDQTQSVFNQYEAGPSGLNIIGRTNENNTSKKKNPQPFETLLAAVNNKSSNNI